MSGELVREVNGRLVFGDAVARVAETLSPLGAAARIVAEASAVGVELRRLSLEGKQIEADKLQALLRVETRRIEAGATIDDMHRTVTATEANAERFRRGMDAAEKAIFRDGVPENDKAMYKDILFRYSAQLVENHLGGGKLLGDYMDKVLNGAGALGPDQPRRSSSGPQRRSGSRTRGQRPR